MSEQEGGQGHIDDPSDEAKRPAADDPFEGLVLDDDFVRGASKQEGSARARMLAARWRNKPPEDTGFREAAKPPKERRKLFARKAKPVDPWGGPRKRSGAGGNLRVFGMLTALVVLLVAVTHPGSVRKLFGIGDSSGTDASSSVANARTAQPYTTATSSAAVAATPVPVDPDQPTREHPFAGSPALNYADNEAGITEPVAQAVGNYSAAQVQSALDLTRKLLIEGNLDRAVVVGGDITPFTSLLDPREDWGKGDSPQELAVHPGPDGSTLLDILTRVDPKETELVGDVIKVNGIMSYTTDKQGILTVHSDYSFVYPVAQVGASDADLTTRSIVRRVYDTQVLLSSGGYYPTPKGMLELENYGQDIANSSCTRLDGFLRPDFPDSPDEGATLTGPAIDPYDRSRPLDSGSPAPTDSASATPGCSPLTRY